ncbi:hypothetical protein TWF694_009246 [Orbilia ellipsospora]|uniref:Ankyrin repeat protein n=1 Tax=Orbilia ellipsospora TaxID=2528407 RepID=A0AAV9XEE6_9PEZI
MPTLPTISYGIGAGLLSVEPDAQTLLTELDCLLYLLAGARSVERRIEALNQKICRTSSSALVTLFNLENRRVQLMLETVRGARDYLESIVGSRRLELLGGSFNSASPPWRKLRKQINTILQHPEQYEDKLPSNQIEPSREDRDGNQGNSQDFLLFGWLNRTLNHFEAPQNGGAMPSPPDFSTARHILDFVISKYNLRIPQLMLDKWNDLGGTADIESYFSRLRPLMVGISKVASLNPHILHEVCSAGWGREVLNTQTLLGINFCHMAVDLDLPFDIPEVSVTQDEFWAKSFEGMSPLGLSISLGRNNLVRAFLENLPPAPINQFDVLLESTKLTDLFQERGIPLANMSELDVLWQVSPLMLAVLHRNLEAVEILLNSPLGNTGSCDYFRWTSPMIIKAKDGDFFMKFPLGIISPIHIALLLQDYDTLKKLLTFQRLEPDNLQNLWCLLGIALHCHDLECLGLFNHIYLSQNRHQLHKHLVRMLNIPGTLESYVISNTPAAPKPSHNINPVLHNIPHQLWRENTIMTELASSGIDFFMEPGSTWANDMTPSLVVDVSDSLLEAPKTISNWTGQSYSSSEYSKQKQASLDTHPSHEKVALPCISPTASQTSLPIGQNPQSAMTIITSTSKTSSSLKSLLEYGGLSFLWPKSKLKPQPESPELYEDRSETRLDT